MDILKRELAPLTDEAWDEIESKAKEVLENHLSARKAVHVKGPFGLEYTVLSEGRLKNLEEEEEFCAGIYEVKPLIETRFSFQLNKWEMDNLSRRAKDIDLSPLEKAVKKSALFEENVIYNGYKAANIQGLLEASTNKVLPFGDNAAEIMASLSQAILFLKDAFVSKPYSLIVGKEAWIKINMETEGYPLKKQIENLIGSEIIYSELIDGALVLPYDNEDIEMTIGNDFSIGYENSDDKIVQLFITESFTFRILDPKLIVRFTI
ncbi:MAG TPA: family 1 encapsulin nanocompartment shell protein [Defluviitaleaceae bacterium]|jgi:uncharacterized linocin/CFP29 family protein|nr:bacteriocin family protein [Candidatus Epulonipiscium sp.]HOA79980.1 family 1 encapsulin nanocompartment shell protein [Defluviitaleaceae bacterium]